jgi:transcriptional regulator with XRE-family HTH domain
MAPANRLKEARKLAGMTQEQLAVKAGVAAATIRNIESGRHPPSARTIERLRLVIDWEHGLDGGAAPEAAQPVNGLGAAANVDEAAA